FLVEASIPATSSNGMEIESIHQPSEPHLISRYSDPHGQQHYISLTGEKGMSITHGEGHEQPDQLQLLYYMNEYSFLADPGYDSGGALSNSTWSGYINTNTMQYDASEIQTVMDFVTYQNEGGLESPYASFILERKVSDHADAELSFDNPAPSVEILSGRVQLNFQVPLSAKSTYTRIIFVVKGEYPYLIDLNDITAETGRNDFVMRYYGNSNQAETQNGWFFWDHSGQPYNSPNHRLFLYTVPLVGNFTEESASVEIQEYENRDSDGDKTPYPVIRKSYFSTEETERFSTAGILKIDESIPASQPQFVSDPQNLSYIIHPINSQTIDLFVFATDTVDRKRSLTIDSGPLEGLDFSLSANKTIGFSRLNKAGNSWDQNPDFTVNLDAITAPAPPTNLTVSIENQSTGPIAFLNWNAPAEGDVEFYEVWKQVRNRSKQTEEPAAIIATPNSNSYADITVIDLPDGEFEQRWFVKAVNSDSLVSEPSNTTDWIFIDTLTAPEEFELFNPFPNPMQLNGKMKYQLAEQSEVSIQIYDILGRPVKTILQESQSPGVYTTEWSARGMGSGIYILQMRAESSSGSSFQKSVMVSVIK
ncbi:MAG: T9SS type A sorting domain-containing protein, partial [Balneolaceae bacterium]|nr:T9SS type A sorting domain-containing protein [Balneolaceae bacterium]